jgi:hypothetical protein
MSETPNEERIVMVRRGRLEDQHGRRFDLAYWQAQDTAARWQAAAQLVDDYFERRGVPPEDRRLRRDIVRLIRPGGLSDAEQDQF